jgi:hypothetical protein
MAELRCTRAGRDRCGPLLPKTRALNVLSCAGNWGVGRAAERADADTSEGAEAEGGGAVARGGANSADTRPPFRLGGARSQDVATAIDL